MNFVIKPERLTEKKKEFSLHNIFCVIDKNLILEVQGGGKQI